MCLSPVRADGQVAVGEPGSDADANQLDQVRDDGDLVDGVDQAQGQGQGDDGAGGHQDGCRVVLEGR